MEGGGQYKGTIPFIFQKKKKEKKSGCSFYLLQGGESRRTVPIVTPVGMDLVDNERCPFNLVPFIVLNQPKVCLLSRSHSLSESDLEQDFSLLNCILELLLRKQIVPEHVKRIRKRIS